MALPLAVPAEPNRVGSLNFLHDTLYSGRPFRALNVLNDGIREIPTIDVDTSLTSKRLVRLLGQNNWMLGCSEERPHDSLGKVPPSVNR